MLIGMCAVSKQTHTDSKSDLYSTKDNV